MRVAIMVLVLGAAVPACADAQTAPKPSSSFSDNITVASTSPTSGTRLGQTRVVRRNRRIGGGTDTIPAELRSLDPRDATEAKFKSFNRR